ncbi:GDP-mannose 4,6-dehydratase [Grimontia kaedaensis]|uniref:GDP-mannose 4,6-dehydratase n=1 Tax=Grimontia kaedaensis TaxID=2872157 RepID=A0ABY4WWU0_9GAMM|nr:GDP-mannose 4,6-dehydratase [Grimontia kaedaensis]USH03270.1 GDP-mannose 4,6-dehydratase [Grimontia kaedaensis]
MKKEKVLLTGVDGFTGKYVKKALLEKGYEVIGLVHNNPSIDEVRCDITDKEALQRCLKQVKPSAIIHLAALSFVGHSDEKAFYDVNVFGATNILEAVHSLELDLNKIIVASSANIYGNPENVTRIDERVQPSPVNHYAMSKLAMEFMVKNWFEKLPIIITRPFNYTGSGQDNKFLIPKIVSHFKENKKTIELGNIDVSRDFSDVRDIANAYVALLESDANSEIVNLCSGSVYSLKEMISNIGKLAGYEIKIKVNPAFVRNNEIKVLGGDNTKLTKLTGFRPSYSIEQTLKDMLNAN